MRKRFTVGALRSFLVLQVFKHLPLRSGRVLILLRFLCVWAPGFSFNSTVRTVRSETGKSKGITSTAHTAHCQGTHPPTAPRCRAQKRVQPLVLKGPGWEDRAEMFKPQSPKLGMQGNEPRGIHRKLQNPKSIQKAVEYPTLRPPGH